MKLLILTLLLIQLQLKTHAAVQLLPNSIIGIEDLISNSDSDGGNDVNFLIQGKAITTIQDSSEYAQEYHLSLKPLMAGATLSNELSLKNLCTLNGSPTSADIQIFKDDTNCEQDFNSSANVIVPDGELLIFGDFNIDGFKNCPLTQFINMYEGQTCEGINISIHIKCLNGGRMNFSYEKTENLFVVRNSLSNSISSTTETQGIPNLYVYAEDTPIPNEKVNFFSEILSGDLDFLADIPISERPGKIQEQFQIIRQSGLTNSMKSVQERGINKSLKIIDNDFVHNMGQDAGRSGSGRFFHSPFFTNQQSCEESFNASQTQTTQNQLGWQPNSSLGTNFIKTESIYSTNIFRVDSFSSNKDAIITAGGSDQIAAFNGLNFNLKNQTTPFWATYACVFRTTNNLCPENFAFIPADPVVGSNNFCIQKEPITDDFLSFTTGTLKRAERAYVNNNFDTYITKCTNSLNPKGSAVGDYGLLSLKEYKALFRNLDSSNYGNYAYYGSTPFHQIVSDHPLQYYINTNPVVTTLTKISCENNPDCELINNPFVAWRQISSAYKAYYSHQILLDYKGDSENGETYYNLLNEPTCGLMEKDVNTNPILGNYLDGHYQFTFSSSTLDTNSSLCGFRDRTVFVRSSGANPATDVLINCSTAPSFETYNHMIYYIVNQDNPENNCPLVVPTKKLVSDFCTSFTPAEICNEISQFSNRPQGFPGYNTISPYTESNPINP